VKIGHGESELAWGAIKLMQLIQKDLEGVFEILLNPITDKRGYFMRVYDQKVFDNNFLKNGWVQENQSLSKEIYTLRGLHFQLPPYCEAKLIRVLRGKILDVYVDLRKGSQTFGKWGSAEISSHQNNMLLIPRGFAHGFLTLEENTEVCYKVDNFYSPEYEQGIIWNDDSLNINWYCENPILSDKDKKQQTFKEFVSRYKSINI